MKKIARWLAVLLLALVSPMGGLEGHISSARAQDAVPRLSLSLNSDRLEPGDILSVTAAITPGSGPSVDVYIAIQLPDQGYVFLQADRSVTPEARPFAAGWTVQPFEGEILRYTVSGGEPLGTYVWLAAFTMPGTLTPIGNVAQAPMTFGAVIFRDDFDDGTADDWTIVEGSWAAGGGEFVESSDTGGHNIAIHGPDMVDFQLTAHLRTTDNDSIGLVFRFQDSHNFYVASLNDEDDTVQLRRRKDGEFRTLESVSGNPYIKGVPVEVGIRAQQARLQVFVNGRTAIDIDAEEVTSGTIGLYSRSNKYAAFDNVRVMALDSLKPVGGNFVYVNASNEGGTEDGLTEGTAWGTITEALRDPRFQNSAGNTIIIGAGVYYEQLDVLARMSGIPGAFNTIRAADGAEVVVDGEKGTANSRVEAVLIHTGVSYVRIEGLTLRNAQHRCLLVFASGPGEIVGNRLHDCGDSGIEFWYGARTYEVARNLIHSNREDGIILSQGSGDDPSRFRANQGIVIRNNLILRQGPASGNGIFVDGAKPHTFAIHNNTIWGNLGNGIFLEQGVGGGDVRNNLVVANGAIGLKNFADLPTDYNNLFANGATGNANYADGPAHAPLGANTISVDPLFVNPAAGDFRLQAGSPCRDAGDPDPRFNDADGTRNDMGASGGP